MGTTCHVAPGTPAPRPIVARRRGTGKCRFCGTVLADADERCNCKKALAWRRDLRLCGLCRKPHKLCVCETGIRYLDLLARQEARRDKARAYVPPARPSRDYVPTAKKLREIRDYLYALATPVYTRLRETEDTPPFLSSFDTSCVCPSSSGPCTCGATLE